MQRPEKEALIYGVPIPLIDNNLTLFCFYFQVFENVKDDTGVYPYKYVYKRPNDYSMTWLSSYHSVVGPQRLKSTTTCITQVLYLHKGTCYRNK